MSDEQLKAFWEAIQADPRLQSKLQGVTSPEGIAAIAKEAGFLVSSEEIKEAQILSTDEDLLGTSGGTCTPDTGFCITGPLPPKLCMEACRGR